MKHYSYRVGTNTFGSYTKLKKRFELEQKEIYDIASIYKNGEFKNE